MGGTGERGVRKAGGATTGGGGRGEMRGGEEATGGGGEIMVSGGCLRGGAGIKGTGVADGRVVGRIPAVSTEGGEAEGGGHGRPGGLPWLLVKGD